MSGQAFTPDQMADLHRLCFDAPRPWTVDEFVALLENPYSFAVQHPSGFLLGRALAGEAEILTLAVHPNARRQGIARGLVLAFFDAARMRSADIAHLDVAADNAAAIALYHACGFAKTGLRRGYYAAVGGAAVDAVLMACPLLPQQDKI